MAKYTPIYVIEETHSKIQGKFLVAHYSEKFSYTIRNHREKDQSKPQKTMFTRIKLRKKEKKNQISKTLVYSCPHSETICRWTNQNFRKQCLQDLQKR